MTSSPLAQIPHSRESAVKRACVPNLDQVLGYTFPVLDHGFIRIIDYLGDDSSITQAARVSYGAGTSTKLSDTGLINYLLRHEHTTPFEMCEIKLHIKAPIFVARQWMRHRTSSINEYSGRYSVMENDFYIPHEDKISPQSKSNKQGREGEYSSLAKSQIKEHIGDNSEESYELYSYLISKEVDLSRELSRMVLPTNIYTQWYWKTNLHNLLRFVRLRADSHAQYEIRVYAELIEKIISAWVPDTFKAYLAYEKNSLKLSQKEIESLKLVMNTDQGKIMANAIRETNVDGLSGSNSFSLGEWKEFIKKLNLFFPEE